MQSNDNPAQNWSQITSVLREIDDSGGSDWVLFPENCAYLRIDSKDTVVSFDLSEAPFKELAYWAQAKQCHIFLGSIPRQTQGKIYNSTIWVNSKGEIKPVYDKVHLFDVDVKGARPVRESEVFTHGEGPSIIEIDGWKVGLSICYDMRFSELFSVYARARADVLLVPSAFLVPTGQAHWHVLLRARAIENQCFVLAAAQAGEHKNSRGHSRLTFGHSLAVGPWGEVLADLGGSGACIKTLTLDPLEIDKVRAQIPMSGHRRLGKSL